MLEKIRNYVRLTEEIGTSGQPEEHQFSGIAAAGYEFVVNLAMPDSDDAIANEGNLVTSLGMTYVHIPVPFDNPTVEQLRAFIRTMDAFEGSKVWVHCIMNYRVSAFMYHYLRIRKGFSETQARSSMFQSWRPDGVWQAFLNIEHSEIDL
jgi:protein tyrosine phosphatase (PTP) superfamily phosphohydrolase (DUF442 family)